MSNLPRGTSIAHQASNAQSTSQPSSHHPNIQSSATINSSEAEVHKAELLTKSLDLVISIKENMTYILDNVAKFNNNPNINSSTVSNSDQLLQNDLSINQQASSRFNNNEEQLDDMPNLDTSQMLFYKETDTKFLKEKSIELNTKLRFNTNLYRSVIKKIVPSI